MIALVLIMSLVVLAMTASIMSSSAFDLSKLRPVSSNVAINRETPDSVLAEEFCKGNIDREIYEMFVAEKMDLKII
jgi:hypothetical protein